MQHFLNSLFLLLVEPSTAQSKIIIQQFEELGITQYRAVQNGSQALDIIDTEQPDIVISAMYLEDMTGTDLVLDMRSNPITEDLPFMLISTVTSFAELNPIKQAGASAILPKPFQVKDLKRAINTTMDWENPAQLELQHYQPENLQVLVVDDSSMSRHMISRTLHKMGIPNVTEAQDGREAIEHIQQRNFDLVITDYNMPEIDGYGLTVYVRQHSHQPDLPVVMVTTEGDQGKLAAVQHQGVSAILNKPLNVENLKRLLESLFAEVD